MHEDSISEEMNRPYDLIVYGATGYLGSLVAQYLWANSPLSLRWAVDGSPGELLGSIPSPSHIASRPGRPRAHGIANTSCAQHGRSKVPSLSTPTPIKKGPDSIALL